MKTLLNLIIAVLLTVLVTVLAHSQNFADSTGLPGDNFSLEAALEAFKKSESPEAFEKMLNTEENKINNLDLNGDGQIDYIKVIDKSEDDAHAFILQAGISENENQDIAVIELEKNGEQATVQIVGDEEIYGERRIVEPVEEVKSDAGTKTTRVIVNVYSWPVVRYVYGPSYRLWISPWRWAARPVWWHPWRPVRHHIYHAYHGIYLHRYAVVYSHRTVHAHRIYTPVRTTSVIVRTRHQQPVNHYRSNRTTRTTTVTTPHGQATRKTTTVRTRGGKKTKSVKRTTRSGN